MQSEQQHGYHLNNQTSIISTDDFNVITTNSRAHQRILTNVEEYANSMNLVIEPSKCKTLFICSGSSKVVKFALSDHDIGSIEHSQERFLGSQITYSGKQSDTFSYIHSGIKTVLDNISHFLIRDEYKVKVYSQYALSAIRFKLTVCELTNTKLTKLDALNDRFVNGWLHMALSGTFSIIHTNEGLGIKTVSHLYREAHAVSHATSRINADDQVNATLDSRVAHKSKWTQKVSITSYSKVLFQSCTTNTPPEPSHTYVDRVKQKVKASVNQEIEDTWNTDVKI